MANTILYMIVAAGAVFILIPFLWMIVTAIKPEGSAFQMPIKWIPFPFAPPESLKGLPFFKATLSNIPQSFTVLPFAYFYRNTLIITALTVLGTLISTSLVGYGFARMNFPGRDILFIIVLSTMMIPVYVTMIPIFITFRDLRWLDSFKPLIVPSFFAVDAIYIFLFRQFIMTIPLEYDDSAKIDGASSLGIFLRIILPLSKPVLGAVAIFSFIAHWNEFLYPLIYLSTREKFTIALGLRTFQGAYQIHWEQMMAASTLALIPIVTIFFICQRYFVQGIVVTGIKG